MLMAPAVRKTARHSPAVHETVKRLVAMNGPDRLEPIMSLPLSVADVLREHVVFEIECVDHLYLNVFQPALQLERHVYRFLRDQRGAGAVSSRFFQAMTRQFVQSIEAFASQQQIPLFPFEKNTRKEDLAATYRAQFAPSEGVLFIGKAQEKCRVYRTEKRRNPHTGVSYAWIVKSAALVNHYYFYCVDRNFGPLFLKFCSTFPIAGSFA